MAAKHLKKVRLQGLEPWTYGFPIRGYLIGHGNVERGWANLSYSISLESYPNGQHILSAQILNDQIAVDLFVLRRI